MSKIRERFSQAWSAGAQAVRELNVGELAGGYSDQSPLEDHVGKFTNVFDLRTVDEAVQDSAARDDSPLSWYDLYQSMLVVPFQKTTNHHPEYEWGFKWDIGSPIPMESGNAPLSERENPTFRVYGQAANDRSEFMLPDEVPGQIVWEYRSTDKYGIKSQPHSYSLVTGDTETGPKVAIMANFTFTPSGTNDSILFSRYTAIMYCAMETRDWLNEYMVLSHQKHSTIEEWDEAREDARDRKRQAREGAAANRTAAARQF